MVEGTSETSSIPVPQQTCALPSAATCVPCLPPSLLHCPHKGIHVLTKIRCRLDPGQLVFTLNRRRAEGMHPTVFINDLSSLSVDNPQFCDWPVFNPHQIG